MKHWNATIINEINITLSRPAGYTWASASESPSVSLSHSGSCRSEEAELNHIMQIHTDCIAWIVTG